MALTFYVVISAIKRRLEAQTREIFVCRSKSMELIYLNKARRALQEATSIDEVKDVRASKV